MKRIIETTQIEFSKSSFLIDLVEHDCGKLYIEIEQVILNQENKKSTLKINPSVLFNIIQVLIKYQDKLPKESHKEINYITQIDQEKIIRNYLKGLSINDLALQFNGNQEQVEAILRNNGIDIVDNVLHKSKRNLSNRNNLK